VRMKWGASLLAALVVGLAGGYAIRYFSTPRLPSFTLPNGRHVPFNPAAGGFPGGGFGSGHGGFATVGKVAAVTGSTLEVQGSSGQTTVKVAGSTTITRTVKVSSSSLASIAVGMCVTAIGPTNSIGTVAATRLVLSAPGPNGCTAAFRAGSGGFGGGAPGGG
jgi:hypothetical protein